MYPNDSDGTAFREGFEPLIKASGYKVVDGGAYQDGTTDFTSMISTFKSKHCEVFSNAPLPPDFNTFWKQASQQGFKPKIATVAKVLLFPADTVALGPLVNNVATDSWWGPYMPYASSLDGQTASALAAAYTSATGNQWVQSIGSSYALFEVAKEAFGAVSDPHDKAAVANALHQVSYTGMNGADQLRRRARAGRRHRPAGRRSVEEGHREVPVRDEGRGQLAEQERQDPGTARADECLMPRGRPCWSSTGVTKSFGRVVVADNLSFTIGGGDIVGIVGPNGAGKTSLFGLIAGDLAPASGEIRFGGAQVTRLNPAARCRLGIGRTFQVPRPFGEMTVFENVLVAVQQGAGLRRRASYAAAAGVLERTGLTAEANFPAERLGLLQRKRLELARALASGPRLLLLDEVAGGLTDPEVAQLVGIVRSIRAEGVAVIWIEHVVRALTAAVERLVCLAAGSFIGDGSPAEVLANPAVREVFLGTEVTTSLTGPAAGESGLEGE